MARSIQEVKGSICAEFMSSEAAASAYGFAQGAEFGSVFSKVSIESILFYTVAVCMWTLEKLLDTFRSDVDARIDEIVAHRPKWYRDKVLSFMKDKTLIPDTDLYDTSAMSDADIAAAKVVKHAVAVENADASILTVKVAGETGGVRQPLPAAVEAQLSAYINEVKDAGVRVNLVNIDPDTFSCAVDIYYDPMLLPENVQNACMAAIKSYIENLPFNGTYSNMSLVDAMQAVAGVRVVEFISASSGESGIDTVQNINGIKVPAAGYFTIDECTLNMKPYEQ